MKKICSAYCSYHRFKDARPRKQPCTDRKARRHVGTKASRRFEIRAFTGIGPVPLRPCASARAFFEIRYDIWPQKTQKATKRGLRRKQTFLFLCLFVFLVAIDLPEDGLTNSPGAPGLIVEVPGSAGPRKAKRSGPVGLASRSCPPSCHASGGVLEDKVQSPESPD